MFAIEEKMNKCAEKQPDYPVDKKQWETPSIVCADINESTLNGNGGTGDKNALDGAHGATS